jgi:uncharacterized protein (UPF0332 family)
MDAQRRLDLWAIALEYVQEAHLAAQLGRHNVSTACSYYAVYTAMWIALGDPPAGKWSHRGILQHFAPGRWRQPPAPIDRASTRAIQRLYRARLRAHYRGARLTDVDSTDGLATARHILRLVATTLGLPQGGIPP